MSEIAGHSSNASSLSPPGAYVVEKGSEFQGRTEEFGEGGVQYEY